MYGCGGSLESVESACSLSSFTVHFCGVCCGVKCTLHAFNMLLGMTLIVIE